MIEDLSQEYYEIDQEIKELTKKKNEIRAEIDKKINDYWAQNSDSAPVKYVIIPNYRLANLNKSVEEYIKLMYPAWDLVEKAPEKGGWGAFLQRKPQYVEHVVENEHYKFSRTIVEPAPNIDIKNLKEYYPDMVESITDKIETQKINDDKLTKWLKDHPEDTALLETFNKGGNPSSRIKVTKKK